MGAKFLIGVGVNLVGSILINLGTNVMKLGHNRRAAVPLPDADKPHISRFREWQLGVAAFAVGNVANFLSFGYAAQSLLAAIGCVQFVSNVIFASLVLKEKVTPAVLAATTCIVVGCVLLVSFGDHTSAVFTAKDLLRLYAKPVYATYLALSAAAVVGCYLLYAAGSRRTASLPPGAPSTWRAALPVLYSVFSALIGTQSVLFSKTLAVLIRATVDGDNQFKSWFIYVVVPCFLFAAVFWITRLNKALKMFPAMVIVPTLQISWTLFSIIGGMLYFREYRDFTPLGSAMFAIGLAVMFAGVFLLTRSAGRQPGGPTAAEADESSLAGVPAGGSGSKLSAYQREDFEFDLSERGATASGATLDAGGAPVAAAGAAGQGEGAPTPERATREEEGAGLLGAGGGQGASASRSDGAGDRGSAALGELRRAVSSLRRRAAGDFDLDGAPAARLALGLGDGGMPAMSVFGPPIIDLGAAGRSGQHQQAPWRRRSKAKHSGGCGGGSGGGGDSPSGGGGGGIPAFRVEGPPAGGPRGEAGPLPAHALMQAPVPAGGGINPLGNAINVRGPPSRPASPLASFAAGAAERARSIRSALSAELQGAAARAAGREMGYNRVDEAYGGRAGDEDRRGLLRVSSGGGGGGVKGDEGERAGGGGREAERRLGEGRGRGSSGGGGRGGAEL